MKPKVSVIGAGNVGAQCALRLVEKNIAEVVLIDVIEGIPQGKALDMCQAGAIDGYNPHILGTNDYADIKDSKVVVVTAGLARKPGMSRDDLINKNAEIIKGVVGNITKYAPNSIILVVTNPLDVMTYHALKISGFPNNRVVGMAPLLDAARMQFFIASELNLPIKEVHAEVMGSHGDLMVPIPRLSTAQGQPISGLLTAENIEAIVNRTRHGGAEIVNLLKTGSAYYAPGSAAAKMAEVILLDEKQIINSCAYLTGQYGISGICLGVPVKLGGIGIEEVIEQKLEPEELAALQEAGEAVRKLCSILG